MTKQKTDYKKFLEPEYISKIKTLQLKARAVVEGFMVGLHKSPYHGFSVEFSQHRPYMQGDAIKNIDWKLYAKSERYYIKQFEEETNLISHIILDVSKSMNYKNKANVTKLEYAATLAASLAFIMSQQQDAVGLINYSDKIEDYLPPKSTRIHLRNILAKIENLQSENKTDTASCLTEAVEKVKRRGLVIIISDLFDEPEKILKAVKKYNSKKNEVIIFQVLDPIEKSFGFEKDGIFIDSETNEEITTFPRQIQKSYQQAFGEFLNTLKSECMKSGIEYNLLQTSEPYDKALFAYFKKRYKLV